MISVSKLEDLLDRICDVAGTKNFDEILTKGGDQVQWRATCKGKPMAVLAWLVEICIDVAENGVLPAKGLEQALLSKGGNKKMIFSDVPDTEWSNSRGLIPIFCLYSR